MTDTTALNCDSAVIPTPGLECCSVSACIFADLSGAAPKYALDGLYGALALLLGINSYNERKALVAVISRKQTTSSATASSSSQGSETNSQL